MINTVQYNFVTQGASDAGGPEERKKREQDEMKNTILTQVLTQSARARRELSQVSLAVTRQ
jgi:DNA-binding TFAR19-related protein (PDSD5 family)